jgi:DNA polymerase sigma
MSWDDSNTIRKLLLLLKKFTKSQNIHGAADGYLSSYCWVLMTLHVLIREQYIPQFELSSNHDIAKSLNDVIIFNSHNLSNDKIKNTSISYLFYRIVTYYSREFNVFSDVVTLRSFGEVCNYPNRKSDLFY